MSEKSSKTYKKKELLNNGKSFRFSLSFFGDPQEVAITAWKNFNRYMKLLNLYPQNKEFYLRQCLDNLLKCFWYYRNARVGLSILMHDIGKYLNKNYGCPVDNYLGGHLTKCPNMLLHKDFGMSIRSKEKHICSICLSDPLECIHRSGRPYDSVMCKYFKHSCNICNKGKKECLHIEGSAYNKVTAHLIVSSLEVITWDIVREPHDVYTRIQELPLDASSIYKQFYGKDWKLFRGNLPINCDHCISCHKYDPNENNYFFDKADEI